MVTGATLTSRRLFFELLHKGRELKEFKKINRRFYLLAMTYVFINQREDFEIADNMRDYWKHQNSGY